MSNKDKLIRLLYNYEECTVTEEYAGQDEIETAYMAENILLVLLYRLFSESDMKIPVTFATDDFERWDLLQNLMEEFGFRVNAAYQCETWEEVKDNLGDDDAFYIKEHANNYLETEEEEEDARNGTFVELAAVAKNSRYDKAKTMMHLLTEKEKERFNTLWHRLHMICSESISGIVDTEAMDLYRKKERGVSKRFITGIMLMFDESSTYASMRDVSIIGYATAMYEMELLITTMEKRAEAV